LAEHRGVIPPVTGLGSRPQQGDFFEMGFGLEQLANKFAAEAMDLFQ
jgi:hypothetical protein